MRLGVVTGLALEARQLRAARDNTTVKIMIATGAGWMAREAARSLVADRAQALLSFGLAGGTNPALTPGDLVVASDIVATTGDRFACDHLWASELIRRLAGNGLRHTAGIILGREHVVATAAEKARLWQDTGAAAVDMESHHVARAAHEAEIPFLAVRAIVDTFEDEIPDAARSALQADGGLNLPQLGRALLRHPQQVPALLRLARRSRAALGALGRVGRLGVALAPPI